MATPRSVGLALAVLILLLAPQARGERLSIGATQEAGAAAVVVAAPGDIGVRPEVAGREVLLRFDREIELPDLEAVAAQSPDFLLSLIAGFDTLLITANRDVLYEIEADGGLVVVKLVPAPDRVPEDPVVREDELLRTRVLQARLLNEQGRPDAARQLLLRLARTYPKDVEVLTLLAGLEEQRGNAARAIPLLNRALAASGNDISVRQEKHRILTGLRPTATTGVELVIGNDGERQIIPRAGIENLRIGGFDLGTELEYRRLSIDTVQRPDGTTSSFSGGHTRGTIIVGRDFGQDWRGTVSLFPHDRGIGGGLAVVRRWADTQVALRTFLNEPYWEFVEGIVDDGRRDRVALAMTDTLITDQLTASAEIGANRYSIDRTEATTRTVTANAALTWSLRPGVGTVALGYGLDGEYVVGRDARTDPFGTPFFPIPVDNREVHALTLTWTVDLTRDVTVSPFVGYALDRYGGQGPIGGASLVARLNDWLSLELTGGQSVTSGRGADGQTTRVQVQLVGRPPIGPLP